ncbi:transmembrane protein 128 isoform X2 [Rana temporaria]|uniref:transmembrane protein 128 isoform X2 n=1 Tax=Rana temporaria TaxID=8407 RepID=UPI001AADD8BB|nr:transmembrane protein 128 isoform X2 [Rana temporaria]
MAASLEGKELENVRRRFAESFRWEVGVTEADDDENEKKKQKPLPRINIHSVFWILAAVAVTHYVDFLPAVHLNLQEGCTWLLVGAVSLVVSMSVALYCIVYLEWYRGICDYDAKYPGLVPVAILTFLVAAVCVNVSLWPVWSYFTPLILFTQFMGFVMLVSLLG